MKKLLKTMLVLVGASAGLAAAQGIIALIQRNIGRFGGAQEWWMAPAFVALCIVIGGVIMLLLSERLAAAMMQGIRIVEKNIVQASYRTVLFGVCGVGFGLIAAFLISMLLSRLGNSLLIMFINATIYMVCIYLGMVIAKKLSKHRVNEGLLPSDIPEGCDKYVDTSVIIDGRILDICKTGVLEGKLIVPEFVLAELQHIADSEDSMRRAKGRRGLDILQKMQDELKGSGLEILVSKIEKAEDEPVDTALLRAAKDAGGKVLTLDYNLNKVAAVQKVAVININELANAIKPLMLPGEELSVCILRKGKERDQGVAYLQDGTMIVVEDAGGRIGEELSVEVTSVLQTAAGRMIFAKLCDK